MEKMKIVIIKSLLLAFLSFGTIAHAEFGGTTLEFLKKNSKRGYLFSDDYLNSFYFGSYNSEKAIQVNIGYDIPIATVTRSSGFVYSAGIPALFHLYMLPQDGTFNGDNLFWDVGFWLQVDLNKKLALRLTPYYHRSSYSIYKSSSSRAIYSNAYINESSIEPLSNDMIYLELLYSPERIQGLEIKGAGGYYYRASVREFLRGQADLEFYYEIPLKFIVRPSLYLKNHLLYEKGFRYGIDGGLGVEIKNSSLKGIVFLLRVFDTPHPGQYYFNSESGIGLDIRFIL